MRAWTHWIILRIILNVLIVFYVLIGLLTLIFQIDARECDSNCGISYAKSVIWSAIWPASWVVYSPLSWLHKS
jgi:hypothetical protein